MSAALTSGRPTPVGGSGRSRPDRPSLIPGRPIGSWAFLGVTVTSFGGPLALAALYAPAIVGDASASAGSVMIAAAVVFVLPLALWLRYANRVASSGGLHAFVEVAAGRRIALLQAGIWTLSYVLYLLYTTASIVYDTLPAVLPGVTPYQPYLEIAIPVALAGVMIAGRAVTLAVTGALAVGQLVLVGVLAEIAISHSAPASSFGFDAARGDFATATGQTALLYVCGSLPFFLGGEVARPHRTVRRGVIAGYLLVAVGVVAVVFPLATDPAFTRAEIPGMSVAEIFAGHGLAVAVGLGVAASIAGVMLVEYLALSRLLHVVTGRSVRSVVIGLGAALVLAAPVSLIDPDRFYDDLLKPSLVALWLSQLVVFAVYPRFVRRAGGRALPAWALALACCAFGLYGLWATVQHATS